MVFLGNFRGLFMKKIPALVFDLGVDFLRLFLLLSSLGLSQLLLEFFEFGPILNDRPITEDRGCLEAQVDADFLNLMPVL